MNEQGALSVDSMVTRWNKQSVGRSYLQPRETDDKYRRGVVGLATGSLDYPGAAVLTTGAAIRSGAGMVRYSGPAAVADRVLTAHPEAVIGIGRTQVWVVGSGTPWHVDPRALHVMAASTPLVLDAGGLIWATAPYRIRVHQPTIITPHAGELAQLLDSYGHHVSPQEIRDEPRKWARLGAELTHMVVLLKGHETTIVTPSGLIIVNDHAPAWLATAGSGDVLAGLLGGIVAMRAARAPIDDEQLATLGATAAWLHGEAAFLASGGGPIIASDIIRLIPRAIASAVSA